VSERTPSAKTGTWGTRLAVHLGRKNFSDNQGISEEGKFLSVGIQTGSKNERLLPDVKEPLFSLFYPLNDRRARELRRANFVFKPTANWCVLPARPGR